MKFRDLCFLALSALPIPMAQAQQVAIDSLERELVNPTNNLSRVEVLNELSWYYALFDTRKGLDKAEAAIKLANATNDSVQLGIAYERKAFNFKNSGKDSLTLAMYDLAGKVYTRKKDNKRLAGLTYNIGNFYFFRSQYSKSLEKVGTALKYYEKEQDSISMARAHNLLGLNHMYLGNYKISMQAFQQGSLLLELTKNQKTQFFAEILGNLALLQEKLSAFEKALDFQNRALAIHKKNGYQLGVSNTYSNIGQSYVHLGKHEKALEMFNAAMEIKEVMGNKYHIANGLTNIGITHFELKHYGTALEFLDRAQSIYEEIGHFTNLSAVHKSIGDNHLAEGRIAEATSHFELALSYAEKSEDKRAALLATEGLASAAYKNLNFERAYRLQERAILLKDSLLSTEKRDELAKIEATYEYDKEKAILEADFEKDTAIQQAKTEKQVLIRNASIGGGIFAMLLLTIGFTLIRRKREAELEARAITSELQTLRAQLNPHFIFNSLNSINDFVQKNERDIASDYLIRFSKMMRKILDNSQAEEVPLSEEIDFLENYIKLEQERLDYKFTFTIEVGDDIDPEETLVPPTLFQPFIENSIWHGLLPKKGEKGHLAIGIGKSEGTLTCTIDDNGVGMSGEREGKKATHNSFGSHGAKTRLELLNQLRGNAGSKIEFVEKEEGLQVKIQLPLSLETDS